MANVYKLTLAEEKLRQRHIGDLEDAEAKLEDLLTDARSEELEADDDAPFGPAREALKAQVAVYNDLLREVEVFVEGICERMREKFDDSTEAWQESDRGQSVQELIDAWENLRGDLEPADDITDADSFVTPENASKLADIETEADL